MKTIPPPLSLFSSCETFKSTASSGPLTPPLYDRVRHHCPNKCFYYAYAPTRLWCSLNTAIVASGQTTDLLKGWFCEVATVGGKRAVTIVAPSGDVFTSINSVLQSLDIASVASVKSVTTGKQTDPATSAPPPLSPRTPILGERFQSHSWVDVDASRPNKKVRTIVSSPAGVAEEIPSDVNTLLHPGVNFIHPTLTNSPLGLLEELAENPFQLLCICIMLNRTTRYQVDCVISDFIAGFGTPSKMLQATTEEIEVVVQPCGMCHRRVAGLKEFTVAYLHLLSLTSEEKLLNDEDLKSLPHIGVYGIDAYRLFVRRECLNGVVCGDRALVMYNEWLLGCKEQRERQK